MSDPIDSYYRRRDVSAGWFVGVIIALAMLAIAYLVFAANTQTKKKGAEPARPYGVTVFLDTSTGCEYISGSLASAITPRLDANGKHICNLPTPSPQ